MSIVIVIIIIISSISISIIIIITLPHSGTARTPACASSCPLCSPPSPTRW
jgi:hypothetical protein